MGNLFIAFVSLGVTFSVALFVGTMYYIFELGPTWLQFLSVLVLSWAVLFISLKMCED